MTRPTVFLSCSPDSTVEHAPAILLNLMRNGFDVFMAPVEAHGDGLSDLIAARSHFVPVVTLTDLAACAEPEGRSRREMWQTRAQERVVVPVLIGANAQALRTEGSDLAQRLGAFEPIALHYERFDEGMAALRAALDARRFTDYWQLWARASQPERGH
jgi:hypothetical protein